MQAEDLDYIDKRELHTASFYHIEGDIIWVRYKDVDQEITEEEAKLHSKVIAELDGGKPKHLIIDFRGREVNFSNEAREYFANNQEHSQRRKSQALLIDNLAHRIVASFYAKFNRPDCPVEIFHSAQDALNWVRSLDK